MCKYHFKHPLKHCQQHEIIVMCDDDTHALAVSTYFNSIIENIEKKSQFNKTLINLKINFLF